VKNSFFSVLLFLLLFWSAGLSAQDNNTKPSPAPKTSIGLKGQVEEDARLLYMYERSFGIMVHSHGFAVNYRRGRSFGERKKGLFDIELSTLRHSKEFRIASGSISNSGSYVYGKLNSVMLVRTGYGIKSVAFRKELLNAIEISWFGAIGASTAMVKPVYLEIIKRQNGAREIEKYDPEEHTLDNIFGKAPWARGVNELRVLPGIYGRFGLQFDYDSEDDGIKFIETGIILDFHPRPLPIMAFNTSNPLTTSLYLSLNFGKKWNY
jgi:hypothetical protein